MNYFKEYSETKKMIEALTSKLKEIEPKLLEEINKSEKPIKNEFGTFTKQVRKTFKFTKVFEDWMFAKKQEVESKKKAEIEAGRVRVEETISPRYISIKE